MDPNPKVILADKNYLPLIGFGTQNFRPNDKTFNINDIVMKAAQAGYTHFDICNNEQLLGDALKQVFQTKHQLQDEEGEKIPDQFELSFPREKFFISYKVYNTPDIEQNVRTALQMMKLQYFDLVMLNCSQSPEPEAKAEESVPWKRQSMLVAWAMLEKCLQCKLVKSLGVANFTTQALLMLHPFVKHPPVVLQLQCHPYLAQKNVLELCRRLQITPIAYCPLLRGGKDQKNPLGDKVDYAAEPLLKDIAGKYAKTVQQILLNYHICKRNAFVVKSQKNEHLCDNFNITDFEIQEGDLKTIEKLDRNGKIKVYQLKNLPIWRGEDPLC